MIFKSQTNSSERTNLLLSMCVVRFELLYPPLSPTPSHTRHPKVQTLPRFEISRHISNKTVVTTLYHVIFLGPDVHQMKQTLGIFPTFGSIVPHNHILTRWWQHFTKLFVFPNLLFDLKPTKCDRLPSMTSFLCSAATAILKRHLLAELQLIYFFHFKDFFQNRSLMK